MKIPYSFLPPPAIEKLSKYFYKIAESIEKFFPFLEVSLKHSKIHLSTKKYISLCLAASSSFFTFMFIIFLGLLFSFEVENFVFLSIAVSLILTVFAFMQQIAYPNFFVKKRIRGIERNLMPALQDMLVQLNSGVPVFNIMVNISQSNYGGVSKEFGRAVREINAGRPQIEALEEIAAINSSLIFRRAIWQIVNGMKSGADLTNVINQIIKSIADEQIIQIQTYGSQLNPLAMFYMIMVVIVPSLGLTFLVTMASFVELSKFILNIIFWGLFVGVMFFQIIFIGLIKSKRPNLLR